MEEMLSAVLYCHTHGVVHRDIKLDNMIFQGPEETSELKLIDFGFANVVKPGREGVCSGWLLMAPDGLLMAS